MRLPSGEAVMARPCPLRVWLKLVIRAPVRMSKATRLARGVVWVPAGAPAGRALVKLPVA
jgi:hypothetical protein